MARGRTLRGSGSSGASDVRTNVSRWWLAASVVLVVCTGRKSLSVATVIVFVAVFVVVVDTAARCVVAAAESARLHSPGRGQLPQLPQHAGGQVLRRCSGLQSCRYTTTNNNTNNNIAR